MDKEKINMYSNIAKEVLKTYKKKVAEHFKNMSANVPDIVKSVASLNLEESKEINILKSLVNCNNKDEVKKELNHNIKSHMEDYHLYRYLASLVESRERNKDIRHSIASWMVHSRHEDLPFNDIFVIDDEVYIYTYRPGLWIGKGGCTINDCLYHINHKIDGTEYRKLNIHLIEAKDDALTDVYGYMRVCQPYSDVNECLDDICDSNFNMAKTPNSNKIKI